MCYVDSLRTKLNLDKIILKYCRCLQRSFFCFKLRPKKYIFQNPHVGVNTASVQMRLYESVAK